MECKICSQKTVKNGFQKSGVQRYKCRCCNKQFQESYVYNAKKPKTNNHIVKLTQEGMGIKSIARYLAISPTTVIEKIKKVAAQIKKPKPLLNMAYEIDELCTFIGNKENKIWICYSYCRETKSVFDFVVGARTKRVIEPLVFNILCTLPQKIYTDKHQTYASIISAPIHSVKKFGTNHIERMNLTLRTHLKRLSRKTICFSKSGILLSACLSLYFWG